MKFKDMNVDQIRTFTARIDIHCEDIETVCMEMKSDKRKSVNKLGIQLMKRKSLWEMERKRLAKMFVYEKALSAEGKTLIAGIDEVGRGPLSGPVVSAAVILPENCLLPGLNDSKKLSEKSRMNLYCKIMEKAVDVSVGIASPKEIDEINILNASKLSMKRAVYSLETRPEHLLIDAVKLEGIGIGQTSIIKGDQKSASIASASIVAKVVRDNIMTEMSRFFKEYGFERNKGYGTPEHIEALKKYGTVAIHRKSFLGGILGGGKN